MIAAMNLKGKKAIVVVVAVEEAVFLVAMHDVVGSVEIEDKLFGRHMVGELIRLGELLD
jgi:hypothetical protein